MNLYEATKSSITGRPTTGRAIHQTESEALGKLLGVHYFEEVKPVGTKPVYNQFQT